MYVTIILNTASSCNKRVDVLNKIYYRNVITSWSSGTGAAGILGALAYAGLTGVFHLTPSTTMYLMLLVPVLMAVS